MLGDFTGRQTPDLKYLLPKIDREHVPEYKKQFHDKQPSKPTISSQIGWERIECLDKVVSNLATTIEVKLLF